MGVLSCSRRGCCNVMCDVYISTVGYVCNECIDEFKNTYSRNFSQNLEFEDITQHLKDFLENDSDDLDSFSDNFNKIEEYFRIYSN